METSATQFPGSKVPLASTSNISITKTRRSQFGTFATRGPNFGPFLNFISTILRYFYLYSQIWYLFFQKNISQGLIFVVDSHDREKIAKSKHQLFYLLARDELRNIPLLVFANKQDLPNAISAQELEQELDLRSVTQRQWHVQNCCTIDGSGLWEGIAWLQNHLQKRFTKESDNFRQKD